MRKIVVIGAGAAGMAAATRARRTDPGASVTVIEATSEFSRGTCSLPYYISGEIGHRDALRGITGEALAQQTIVMKLETRVTAIEAGARTVHTSRNETIPFDRLIVGTGSRTKPVPTVSRSTGHPRLWKLRDADDADHIRRQLAQLKPRRVAVIGGGYLGLEMAEVLTKRGCQVVIFHRSSTLMRLAQPGHDAVMTELAFHGVEARTECEVRLVDPDSPRDTVEFVHRQGERQSEGFDAVFLAAGILPDSGLLGKAGARLGPLGGVVVDSRGETSLPSISAAGDGVELPAPWGGGSPRFIPLATTAARLGRVCGENAAGGSRRLSPQHACLAVRLFTLQVASVGHPVDWTHARLDSLHFGSPTAAFPRRRPGSAVFLTHPRDGKLLGAQFVSPEAASLADLASIALSQSMRVEDFQDLDFTYTPTLSSLWHPFYLAARQLEKASRPPQGTYRP